MSSNGPERPKPPAEPEEADSAEETTVPDADRLESLESAELPAQSRTREEEAELVRKQLEELVRDSLRRQEDEEQLKKQVEEFVQDELRRREPKSSLTQEQIEQLIEDVRTRLRLPPASHVSEVVVQPPDPHEGPEPSPTKPHGPYRFGPVIIASSGLQLAWGGALLTSAVATIVYMSGLSGTRSLSSSISPSVSAAAPAALYWNAWTEEYSSDRRSFAPVLRLNVNRQYSLVVELSAFEYTQATVHTSASAALKQQLINESGVATVTILAIPDERYLLPQSKEDRTRDITLDIGKIREAEEHVRDPAVSPNGGEAAFASLQRQPDQWFSYGRKQFKFETKDRTGTAFIALSVWVGHQPVDELQVPVCIVKTDKDPCEKVTVPPRSLIGVDPVDHKRPPDAALHLVQLGSDSLVGVFRCNTCRDWPDDEFKTWMLNRPASWVQDRLEDGVITPLLEGETVNTKDELNAKVKEAGTNLFDIFFRTSGSTSNAALAFRKFFADRLSASGESGKPKGTVFARLLPENGGLRFPLPLDLMAVPIAEGQSAFLGAHFLVQAALPVQDYGTSTSCVSSWMLLLPAAGLEANDPLYSARQPFQRWVAIFKRWNGGATVKEGDAQLKEFGDWLREDTSRSPASSVLVTLSHHVQNKICFADPACSTGPRIFSVGVKREVKTPSVAILNACGTANPKQYEFIRELNERGVSAVIATTVSVNGDMAGQFLDALTQELFDHRNDVNYSLSSAKFTAVSRLRPQFGDIALIYSLLGNGMLRPCAPPQGPE